MRVVDQINRFLAVVLLRDVDTRAMANSQANTQVLEAETKPLAIAVRSKADVGVLAHRAVSASSTRLPSWAPSAPDTARPTTLACAQSGPSFSAENFLLYSFPYARS